MVELNTAIADYTAARPLICTAIDSDKAFDQRHVYKDMLAGAAGGQARGLCSPAALKRYPSTPHRLQAAGGTFSSTSSHKTMMNLSARGGSPRYNYDESDTSAQLPDTATSL